MSLDDLAVGSNEEGVDISGLSIDDAPLALGRIVLREFTFDVYVRDELDVYAVSTLLVVEGEFC